MAAGDSARDDPVVDRVLGRVSTMCKDVQRFLVLQGNICTTAVSQRCRRFAAPRPHHLLPSKTKFETFNEEHEEHEEHESNLSEVGLTRLLHCTGAGMESWTELFGVELSVQRDMLSIL